MFLAGYGGMVSLAQMTIAAVGGYGVANSRHIRVGGDFPRLAVVAIHTVAILIAAVFGTLVGALAVRTEGIYTIMITLAIASAFFYFARQNYEIFNGYSGFKPDPAAAAFRVDWRQPTPFLLPVARLAAAIAYFVVVYVSRFALRAGAAGRARQSAAHAALGYNVTTHRIAAYTFASVIAAVGGILLVCRTPRSRPGTAGIPAVIDILVIAVVGGVRRPIGPFVGALIYVLLRTFSPDVLETFGMSNERFKTLIGLGFLAVVFFSPDGVLGLWGPLAQPAQARSADRGRAMSEATAIAGSLASVSTGNALELRGVTKLFGALAAISDITFIQCGRASAARCWLERCGQDDACSTVSPAISCRRPAPSACSARM